MPEASRPAAVEDIPELAHLYAEERSGYLVSSPFHDAFWRYQIERAQAREGARARLWLLRDSEGVIAGYVACGPQQEQGELVCETLWLRGGLWLDATPSLLRALRDLGGAFQARVNDAPPLDALLFYLPTSHPLHTTLRALDVRVEDKDDAYAWYVRVSDLPTLLRKMAPVLERRLAASPFAGCTGPLEIDLYRNGVRLAFENGKLADVVSWRAPVSSREPTAGIPPDAFPQLLFGYRDLRELRHIYPDVQVGKTPAALLPVLFSRRESWALPLG